MGLLAARYLKHVVHSSHILAMTTIGFCSLYGLSDEWHQSYVPGRQSDAMDWLADSIGGGLAAMMMFMPTNIRLQKCRA